LGQRLKQIAQEKTAPCRKARSHPSLSVMMFHVMDDVTEHMVLMMVVMMVHGMMPVMMVRLCLGHSRQESEAGHQKGGGDELLQHANSFNKLCITTRESSYRRHDRIGAINRA
jgi:hypothetical protein